jgi:hypothetical protein
VTVPGQQRWLAADDGQLHYPQLELDDGVVGRMGQMAQLGREGCHEWANAGENKEERFEPGESFWAEFKEVNKKGDGTDFEFKSRFLIQNKEF